MTPAASPETGFSPQKPQGLGRRGEGEASQSQASRGHEGLGSTPQDKCKRQKDSECRPAGGGGRYHDEALCQAGSGQEVDDTQPLGETQVAEGGWLQCDGVGHGRPHSRLPLKARWPPHRLGWGQAGLRGQPLVQVRQLLGVQWSEPGAAVPKLPRATAALPSLAQRPLSTARAEEEVGQCSAHFYLHPANVNGQDSGEKQHLKEEVRHQAHDGKKAKLLEKGK